MEIIIEKVFQDQHLEKCAQRMQVYCEAFAKMEKEKENQDEKKRQP